MNASAADMKERLKRWPLVAQPSNRGESFYKDARLVNAIAELDPNTGEFWVQKRIGYTVAFSNLIVNGLGRGMYPWFATPFLTPAPDNYAIIGNGLNATLFKNGAATGTVLGLPDSNGNWMFTETQPASGTRYLIFAPPFVPFLYYTSGTGWTQATLPATRGNYIAGLAYLDGTIYFMDERCQIFGSALEDPTTWTTTNVVTAKKIPGIGIGLVRQNQYLLAIKSTSMEVFYDGAGQPPGSPLLQIDGATTNYGCISHETIREIDGTIFYATNNLSSSIQIVRVDNLVPTVVSTPAIEKLLEKSASSGQWRSWTFKHGGHRYYGLSDYFRNITMVYDLDQGQRGMWYQWTDTDGTYFKIQSTGISSGFDHWFLHAENGSIYKFDIDENLPTDNGVVAPVDIYTPNEDFGTQRGKTLWRMNLTGDQHEGSLLFISHSDNDYQSWSTPRKVNMNRPTPYIDNEGTFTRRAYRFRHAAPTPFRLRSADLQMELCTV